MKFKMVRYRTIYLYILSIFTLFILLFGKFLLESSGFPQFLYAPLVLTVCVIWLANLLYNPKYIKVSNDAVTIHKGWFNRTHFLLNDINNVELVYSFPYNNPPTENGFERIPIYYAPYFSERHTAEGKSHLTKLAEKYPDKLPQVTELWHNDKHISHQELLEQLVLAEKPPHVIKQIMKQRFYANVFIAHEQIFVRNERNGDYLSQGIPLPFNYRSDDNYETDTQQVKTIYGDITQQTPVIQLEELLQSTLFSPSSKEQKGAYIQEVKKELFNLYYEFTLAPSLFNKDMIGIMPHIPTHTAIYALKFFYIEEAIPIVVHLDDYHNQYRLYECLLDTCTQNRCKVDTSILQENMFIPNKTWGKHNG